MEVESVLTKLKYGFIVRKCCTYWD